MSRMSISMRKGKAPLQSIPAIRFNPGEEDLEEVLEVLTEGEEDDKLSSLYKTDSDKSLPDFKERRSILSSSCSADATKESSPVKENKLGKRSTSLDSGASMETSGDAWSLFYEIKGKIAKTMEEKLHIDLHSNGSKDSGDDKSITQEDVVVDDESVEMKAQNDSAEMAKEATESFEDVTDNSSESTSPLQEVPNIPIVEAKDKAEKTSIFQELRQRRNKLSQKSDSFVMSMSTLATVSMNDDLLEEELHTEYENKVNEEELKNNETFKEANESISPKFTNPLETCQKKVPKRELKNVYPWKKYILYACLVIAYLLAPIPSLVTGFLLGILISVTVMKYCFQFIIPSKPTERKSISDFHAQVPLKVPENKVENDTIHKGWMNQLLQEYSPFEYHISQTFSVYLRLEGNVLRVSYPKCKIPKHGSWNEPSHELSFTGQNYFDLNGCQLLLLPEGLTRKRLWSRKYPICIQLCENSEKNSSLNTAVSGDEEAVTTLEELHEGSFEGRLYFFARTCREKEEWYRKFECAIQDKTNKTNNSSVSVVSSTSSSPQHHSQGDSQDPSRAKPALVSGVGGLFSSSVKSQQTAGNQNGISPAVEILYDTLTQQPIPSLQLDFNTYMRHLIPSQEIGSCSSSPKHPVLNSPLKKDGKDAKDKLQDDTRICPEETAWLNALLGRCFWDFLRERYWADMVAAKIQKKLSKIKVPLFMEELTLTHLDLGTQLPVIHRTSLPKMDHQGLWIDLDLTYKGFFKMTLETKLNLMKLKKDARELASPADKIQSRPALFDSDEEDSAESSSDEDIGSELVDYPADESTGTLSGLAAAQGGGSTSKKILRIVDKITQSRYFQHATEYKYIRRAMQEVSNTRLILAVEVHDVVGTLSVNIPPPPTDRLWYGFKTSPKISLVARPRLGEREVSVASITDWIEKKLIQEFQKVFVMPNMDDFLIPIMSSGISNSNS